MKSHIPAANAPAWINVQISNPDKPSVEQSDAPKKRGRPLGSKDLKPRKTKKLKDTSSDMNTDEITDDTQDKLPTKQTLNNIHEVFMNYVHTGIEYNWTNVDINEIFAYSVAIEIMNEINDFEQKSVDECRCNTS